MVKLHLPNIYMFLFNFLIWRKYNDDYVFTTIIVCFDYEFENEEGTRVFLLQAPNSFGWALQPYWPWNKNGEEVDYKIREKERKTRDALWSKPQKKAESVFEEVGMKPKNSKRRAWEGRVWSQKCWKVRGYFRIDGNYYFLWNYQQKSCTYAVNIISPYV